MEINGRKASFLEKLILAPVVLPMMGIAKLATIQAESIIAEYKRTGKLPEGVTITESKDGQS